MVIYILEGTRMDTPYNAASRQMEKPRAMLVDDERDYARVVSLKLRRLGFDVDTFNDPEQALQHAAQHPTYDVIIVDYHMPRLNGHEFLYRLRNLPGMRDARALMQTGSELEQVIADQQCSRGRTRIISKSRFQMHMDEEVHKVLDAA